MTARITIPVIFRVLVIFWLLSGCAMLREGNPITTPDKSYGPCGSWVDCGADQPKGYRCCPPTTACRQRDDDRFCVADPNYDPEEPATWGARSAARYPRHAAE